MIEKDFVNRKVALIQDDLNKLKQLGDFSLEQVTSDPIKQAALERLLERIITRAIDINQHLIKELAQAKDPTPKDYRATFLQLAELGLYDKEFAQEIGKSVGTRNILVHEYDKIDQGLVYESMSDCLRDYTKYLDHIIAFLDKQK